MNRKLRKIWIIGSSAYGQVLWDGSAHLQSTGGAHSLWLSPWFDILVKQPGFVVNVIRYGEHQQQSFIQLSVGSVQSDVLNGPSLNPTNWLLIMVGLHTAVNCRCETNLGQEGNYCSLSHNNP